MPSTKPETSTKTGNVFMFHFRAKAQKSFKNCGWSHHLKFLSSCMWKYSGRNKTGENPPKTKSKVTTFLSIMAIKRIQ
jgi:hypothetical protein